MVTSEGESHRGMERVLTRQGQRRESEARVGPGRGAGCAWLTRGAGKAEWVTAFRDEPSFGPG